MEFGKEHKRVFRRARIRIVGDGSLTTTKVKETDHLEPAPREKSVPIPWNYHDLSAGTAKDR